MTACPGAYVEHVAVWVRDIHWHIGFFREVLGMAMREVQGSEADPAQYWTLGGMQFIARPDFAGPEGLGIMCEDREAAIAAAQAFGVAAMPQGRNWLRLPDGLAVELMQASPGSVARALAVNRAPDARNTCRRRWMTIIDRSGTTRSSATNARARRTTSPAALRDLGRRPGQMIDRPGVPPGWRCPPSNSLCSLANSCASGTPGSR